MTEDAVAEVIPCGPDPAHHVDAVRSFVRAGFDRVYVHQVGPDQAGFLDFYATEVLPRLATSTEQGPLGVAEPARA